MVESIRRYSIYLAPKTFSRDIVLFEGIQVLGGVVMSARIYSPRILKRASIGNG
jgi:hypothetical protein